MTWTTLTLQVTTPLFNGGGDAGAGLAGADDGEGVRVASIRGAMRFWFRALVGIVTGPGNGSASHAPVQAGPEQVDSVFWLASVRY